MIFNTVTYTHLIYLNVKYKENKINNNKEIRSSKHTTIAAKIYVAPDLANNNNKSNMYTG